MYGGAPIPRGERNKINQPSGSNNYINSKKIKNDGKKAR